jgi:hypothetical protein
LKRGVSAGYSLLSACGEAIKITEALIRAWGIIRRLIIKRILTSTTDDGVIARRSENSIVSVAKLNGVIPIASGYRVALPRRVAGIKCRARDPIERLTIANALIVLGDIWKRDCVVSAKPMMNVGTVCDRLLLARSQAIEVDDVCARCEQLLVGALPSSIQIYGEYKISAE